MHRHPRPTLALLALVAGAVATGCGSSSDPSPAASSATSPPTVAPTISEVIRPTRPSTTTATTATTVDPDDDAAHTQFRPVLEDVPADTPTDAFAPAAERLVLEIDDGSGGTRRVRLGPAIVDRTAVRYTVYRSDDGVEVQFALDPGPDGVERFDAAAVGCQERSPSCPTGRIAYVQGGELVADPVVTGAPYGEVSILIAGGAMGLAPPDSPFS